MKEETKEKYLNKTFGVITTLEVDYILNSRVYLKCKCNRCGNITSTRIDYLNNNPKSCKYCVNTLQKEIADAKYKPERNFNLKWNSLKSNAKSRNLEFNLIKKDVKELLKQNCYYCSSSEKISIDRLDSSKDYSINNVVPCCSVCNIMKNKYSLNIFFDRIEKIYLKHLNKVQRLE